MTVTHQEILRALAAAMAAVYEHADEGNQFSKLALDTCLQKAVRLQKDLK